MKVNKKLQSFDTTWQQWEKRGKRRGTLQTHTSAFRRRWRVCVWFFIQRSHGAELWLEERILSLESTAAFMCKQPRFRSFPAALFSGQCSTLSHSSLLQSVHRIRSRSGKKPEPTSDTEQREHLKQGWCHCRSSKETYFPSPNPETETRAAYERLVKECPNTEFNNSLTNTQEMMNEFQTISAVGIKTVSHRNRRTVNLELFLLNLFSGFWTQSYQNPGVKTSSKVRERERKRERADVFMIS